MMNDNVLLWPEFRFEERRFRAIDALVWFQGIIVRL